MPTRLRELEENGESIDERVRGEVTLPSEKPDGGVVSAHQPAQPAGQGMNDTLERLAVPARQELFQSQHTSILTHFPPAVPTVRVGAILGPITSAGCCVPSPGWWWLTMVIGVS